MAVSTATITVFPYPKGFDNTQRNVVVRGTFKVTFGTYPPGGFPLNWNNLVNVNGETLEAIPLGGQSPNSTGVPFPIDVDVNSAADQVGFGGTGPSGYIYAWDSVLGNLHIFEAMNGASANSGPLVEFGGNLDANIVNDSIQFTAYFPRNN
jgi:hypothetical protein